MPPRNSPSLDKWIDRLVRAITFVLVLLAVLIFAALVYLGCLLV